MRGDDHQQAGMWSYLSPEHRVPADHPLRPIRAMVDTVLADLSPEFAKLYSRVGRRSRRRSCCAPCCCKSCTARGANGC